MNKPHPALFIGHGNPMNTLEDNANSRAWHDWGTRLPRPRAILVISAHWETEGLAVTAMPCPRTIHDFAGFPRRLADFSYPAPGDPDLARRVAELLAPEPVRLDQDWGLDHGAWSILAHLYPTAGVPVVQLSLDGGRDAATHLALARRLRPLRDEGVLILGSGNIVHNLPRTDWHRKEGGFTWAERFNNRVRRQLREHDLAGLCRLDDDDARLAVPTPEHYLPLLYVAAVRDAGEYLTLLNDHIEFGAIAMLSAWVGHMKTVA
ncbi:MAG: 4,5-DOPA dioxygenase extradiol [Pseudomonadota bacterium]|nr:4,5-DOPA dioxygenase extradiol [Pseudomonadota bacterium]